MGIAEDFLTNNLNEIDVLQHYLVEMLKSADDNMSNSNFEIYQNFNGENILKYKNADGNLIHYTSYYNPKKQAKEMISHINFDLNRNSVVCIGVGLGYQIDELLCELGRKSIIIVVERDIKLLKEVLKLKDYSKAIKDHRLLFIVGESCDIELFNQISSVIRTFAFNIASMQDVVFPIFDTSYISYSNEVFEYINNYKEAYCFGLGNDVDDTLVGIENMFSNVPRYIKNPGINDFKEKFNTIYKDKPAIVIASGPSLNKNIELLKKAKGKALLLACDGSISSLKKHGIVPDVVGSVERIYKTYEAFYKDKEFDNEVVLVAPAVVKKEIPDTFKNKILSCFKNDSYAYWFNKAILDKGTVWSASSVAHLMFGLAYSLGCNPIVLVGQDLAYSEEGVSHAEEAEVKEKVNLDKVEVYVEGINGKMLPSTYVWKRFLDIFEEGIRSVETEVIDATEGGAHIKGTEIKTLKEVIDKYCKEDIPSFRKCIDSLEISDEYIKKASESIIKLSKREIKKLKLFKARAENALKENSEALNTMGNGIEKQEQLDQIYDCIEYVENKIVKRALMYTPLSMLFQFLIYRAAYKISTIKETEYNIENLKLNLETHKELLEDIIKYADKALVAFEKGIKNVEESMQ